MGSVDSSGEMPQMPGMPPQDEPSFLEKFNNFNVADALDGRITAVEDALNKDPMDVAKEVGRMVWNALTADEEEKKPGYADTGIIPGIDPDDFSIRE